MPEGSSGLEERRPGSLIRVGAKGGRMGRSG